MREMQYGFRGRWPRGEALGKKRVLGPGETVTESDLQALESRVASMQSSLQVPTTDKIDRNSFNFDGGHQN